MPRKRSFEVIIRIRYKDAQLYIIQNDTLCVDIDQIIADIINNCQTYIQNPHSIFMMNCFISAPACNGYCPTNRQQCKGSNSAIPNLIAIFRVSGKTLPIS